MNFSRLLFALGASLALQLPASAAAEEATEIEQIERKALHHAEEAEGRVRHLVEAANHLRKAGMGEQADHLMAQVDLVRQELEANMRHLKELRAHHEAEVAKRRAQAEEMRVRKERELRQLRREGTPAEGVEEGNDQALRKWDEIRRRAQPDQPLEPIPHPGADTPPPPGSQPGDHPAQRPETAPDRPAARRAADSNPQVRLLHEILRTLQRIEAKMNAEEDAQGDEGSRKDEEEKALDDEGAHQLDLRRS